MKQEAYNLAAYAVEQFVTEMEISKHIKAQFDEKYGPTWHCVVGSDFKLQCTHEAKHFIFFYHGKTAVAPRALTMAALILCAASRARAQLHTICLPVVVSSRGARPTRRRRRSPS